ncbi:hypothetical protein ABBQ38_010925, partial [Trebouxia sp. C0009 RCD-2024]
LQLNARLLKPFVDTDLRQGYVVVWQVAGRQVVYRDWGRQGDRCRNCRDVCRGGCQRCVSSQIQRVFGQGDTSQWVKCIQLNLLAPMALTKAFSPAMVEKKVSVAMSTALALLHPCVGAQLCHGSWRQDLYWKVSLSTWARLLR